MKARHFKKSFQQANRVAMANLDREDFNKGLTVFWRHYQHKNYDHWFQSKGDKLNDKVA